MNLGSRGEEQLDRFRFGLKRNRARSGPPTEGFLPAPLRPGGMPDDVGLGGGPRLAEVSGGEDGDP